MEQYAKVLLAIDAEGACVYGDQREGVRPRSGLFGWDRGWRGQCGTRQDGHPESTLGEHQVPPPSHSREREHGSHGLAFCQLWRNVQAEAAAAPISQADLALETDRTCSSRSLSGSASVPANQARSGLVAYSVLHRDGTN